MRLYPFALIPLILAVIAIGMAFTSSGIEMYLTIGVGIATLLVSASVLFMYGNKSTEVEQIPLENFSLWADIGEPASELRRLSLQDGLAAAQITRADLSSLASNAELLRSRSQLLAGRTGFENLREDKIHRRVEFLLNDINTITDKIKSPNL